jgi:hypothetical protein
VSNQLLTTQAISFEALMMLENDLVIAKRFYTEQNDKFGKKGDKIGDTFYMRKPARFQGRDGAAYTPEGLTDTQVPIVINQQSGVDWEASSQEMYLDLDDMSRRYVRPATESIANKIDLRCALMAVQNTSNLVGTVGVTPGLSGSDSFLTYSQAGERLVQGGFPKKGLTMALTATAETGWNTYSKAFFNPSGKLSSQWDSGTVSNALSYDWHVDENLPTQTIGALGGTPVVDGANQTGTSINTRGWSNSISGLLNVGDVITYPSVFMVNPQSRQSTGVPFAQVVQATAASDGSGLCTLSLYPALVPSGQYQNCTASPADGALISVNGVAAAGQSAIAGASSRQMLLWHPQAFALAYFPGQVPKDSDAASVATNSKTGVSIRFVRTFDPARDMWPTRFDVYYGMSPLYTEGACRIQT